MKLVLIILMVLSITACTNASPYNDNVLTSGGMIVLPESE